MKTYKIRCDFGGAIRYEIEAESKEDAMREAKDLFSDENPENIVRRIGDEVCYTVEDEYDNVML